MISVASLLNPEASRPVRTRLSSSHYFSYSTNTSSYNSPLLSRELLQRQKMGKDGAIFTKAKIKGEVLFPPFEGLDENSLREVEKYVVYPLGKIQDFPRHIPYNSEKKSFLDKTGRESFEVFQYEYKVPGDEKIYTVMWDYNVGLVRITPFFKCCKYSKTTPAKMLSQNPGLKEITHSITGGALAAQGYWMPYSCAAAVCATFCDHISGALIPIFGPDFPSQCIPTTDPDYGRMVIDPSIIGAAAADAHAFREKYSTPSPSSSIIKLDSPSSGELIRDVEHLAVSTPSPLDKRLRLKRTFTNSGLYNSEVDESDTSLSYPCSPATPTSYSSFTSNGWTTDNTFPTLVPAACSSRSTLPTFSNEPVYAYGLGHRSTMSWGASPLLSAIPRSISGERNAMNSKKPAISKWQTSKRRVAKPERPAVAGRQKRKIRVVETDEEYDGEESASWSDKSAGSDKSERSEKKAARLLMNLSFMDRNSGSQTGIEIETEKILGQKHASLVGEGPLVKRRRAVSF